MASCTQIVERRRALRRMSAGKWRKAQAKNRGNTGPNLPLNKPNANEKAQLAARAKAEAQA